MRLENTLVHCRGKDNILFVSPWLTTIEEINEYSGIEFTRTVCETKVGTVIIHIDSVLADYLCNRQFSFAMQVNPQSNELYINAVIVGNLLTNESLSASNTAKQITCSFDEYLTSKNVKKR